MKYIFLIRKELMTYYEKFTKGKEVVHIKRMMFGIFGLMFTVMLTAAPASACDIGNAHNLSAQQLQALKVECEKMKLDASKTIGDVPTTPEDVAMWTSAAQGMAKAIGIAAKELGVAANEFLMSPAGILVTLVIIWKVMGSFFIGLFMLITVNVLARGWLNLIRTQPLFDEQGNPTVDEHGKVITYKVPLLDMITGRNHYNSSDAQVWTAIIMVVSGLLTVISFVVMA